MRLDSESTELTEECQTGGVSPLDEHGSALSYLGASSVFDLHSKLPNHFK